MWGQIGDEITTEIPPDGITPVDVYASFDFSGATVPEGTSVKFLIGKLKNDSLEDKPQNDTEIVVKKWTEDEIKSRVIGIEGVELSVYESKIVNTVIRDNSGNLLVKQVAKTTIKPIGDILKDKIFIVAYCSYDKLNEVKRLQPDVVSFTVSSGNGGKYISAIDRYRISTNTWERITNTPTARTGASSHTVNGKIYVIGGYNDNFLTKNEEYELSSGEWSEKTDIPTARAYSSSIIYNNKIYIFGGINFSPNAVSNLAYKYNPSTNAWSLLEKIPNRVAFGTAQVIGTKVYLCSGASSMSIKTGENESQSVDKFNLGIYSFDLINETWTIENPSIGSYPSTTLLYGSSSGSQLIEVNKNNLPPYGVLVINENGANEERLIYDSYDSQSNFIKLSSGLLYSHVSGEIVKIINLPEARLSPNSHVNGSELIVFNGKIFNGYNVSSNSYVASTVRKFDTVSKTFVIDPTITPVSPRYKCGDALSQTGIRYILGGSNTASEWQNKVETFDGNTFTGPSSYAKMPQSRTGLSATAEGDYIYAIGGNGSGHEEGWLEITVEASPSDIRADGRSTASIAITAKDDSGDPPKDGTMFLATGVVYLPPENISTEGNSNNTIQPSPIPRTTVLPILFSSKNMIMKDGIASTVILPRSEDPIKKIEELVPANSTLDPSAQGKYQVANEKRSLYNTAIEVSVIDDYYFGATDTDSAISGSESSNASYSAFSFSPKTISQGLSAVVSYYSDINSIPDILTISNGLADSIEAKEYLNSIREEIPFGASPYFDAMYKSTDIFSSQYDTSFPQKGVVVATLDNDESFSVYSPDDIIESANTISGVRTFPIFATSFVVTDPVSLSARRARTDVADLEKISFNTGGNSFSLIDSSYVQYVIERIKTSAPASFGSGKIIGTHSISGYLSSVSYNISNLVLGNSAEMSISYSVDGYNFKNIDISIPPNVIYSIGSPINVLIVKYEITLRSNTLDSPVLNSVSINYSKPNVQYLFNYPRQISGQIAELASVVNARLPDGGTSEIGFSHGESFMFDRDFASVVQPAAKDRGSIMAINRSFDTMNEGVSTEDILITEDYFVYKSISGNWAQGSSVIVSVNGVSVDGNEYLAVPEKGVIAFRRKLRPNDIVTLEVVPPSVFRYGIKITNPSTTSTGLLDSFAYEFTTTSDQLGGQINRPPRAVNLFITPSPAQHGGPITANYTFVDPDGDEEDVYQTKIIWYKNGAPIQELQNKKTISNSNFKAQRADNGNEFGIASGQEWYFAVTPSDGKMFGSTSRSPKIVIATTPPIISKSYLRSSNDDPSVFSSSDTISVEYEYTSIDSDPEQKSIYTWFVNGTEVKSGTQRTLGPEEADLNGNKFLSTSSTVSCSVIPSNGKEYGQSYSTNTITVQASIPIVDAVKITPVTPTTLSILRISYIYKDQDGLRDQSVIYWYKNSVRMSEFDNTRQIPSSSLSPGNIWYATVTPSNGYVSGELVKSNIVTIEF